MTIDRGSLELIEPVDGLVVCGDAVVTVRADVLGNAEVLEAATLKLYGQVTGNLDVNTSGRIDIHGIVDGELRVEAGDVRVIGSVGRVSGAHANAVKLCTGCLVGGERQF